MSDAEPGACPFCAWDHPGDTHSKACVIGRHVDFAHARGVADERAAATVRVVTLLSTPLASKDFLEGVRRAMDRIRSGPSTTAVDGEHEEGT